MNVRGVQLALHPQGEYMSDVVRDTGDFFEAAILDELATRITGGTLVDVGAMIGNHTTYLAAFVPHFEIHAFEPLPANLELLRQNVAPFPSVTVHPYALSDTGGLVRLDTPDPASLGHTMVDPLGSIEVEAFALDSLALDDVQLIKIDVEGHEAQVLAGAKKTIERCQPLMVIEDWEIAHVRRLAEVGYVLERSWPDHQTYLYVPIR